MLRRSFLRRTEVRHTSVPAFVQHPVEMAFYFPRFHPATHIDAAGIPELTDAVAMMTRHSPPATPGSTQQHPAPSPAPPRWTTITGATAHALTDASVAVAQKDNGKALLLLERGIDILNSVGGVRNPAIANLQRPLYAARFELLNGNEHVPHSEYAARMHVHKAILQQAAPLLYYNDHWDKKDVRQVDTACVLVAHFVKAFCALHPLPFHSATAAAASADKEASSAPIKSPLRIQKKCGGAAAATPALSASPSSSTGPFGSGTWRMAVGGGGDDKEGEKATASLTLPMVQDRVDELLQLADAAYEKHRAHHPELRWLRPKLLVLKGLLTIPITGHLLHAQRYITEAAHYVDRLTKRENPLLDGFKARTHEPELGLYMLLQAEMSARVLGWSLPPGKVDSDVVDMFTDAAGFYADPPNTPLEADGIMSSRLLPDQRFEAEAYACCLRSYAEFLLGAPHPAATTTRDAPVFLPGQLFSLNPLLTVTTPSSLIFSDPKMVTELSLEQRRRRTGDALERALKLNRMLFPELRQNASAASTLLTMACMYADTRDYLYATGLFESAKKALVYNYGEASLEHAFAQKLRYEFLAGVGSEDEAKTAAHEVVHLLKDIDALPC